MEVWGEWINWIAHKLIGIQLVAGIALFTGLMLWGALVAMESAWRRFYLGKEYGGVYHIYWWSHLRKRRKRMADRHKLYKKFWQRRRGLL